MDRLWIGYWCGAAVMATVAVTASLTQMNVPVAVLACLGLTPLGIFIANITK